jgi:hypothetical protein
MERIPLFLAPTTFTLHSSISFPQVITNFLVIIYFQQSFKNEAILQDSFFSLLDFLDILVVFFQTSIKVHLLLEGS